MSLEMFVILALIGVALWTAFANGFISGAGRPRPQKWLFPGATYITLGSVRSGCGYIVVLLKKGESEPRAFVLAEMPPASFVVSLEDPYSIRAIPVN